MNESTEKLKKQALEKMKPFINQLVKEGCDRNIIVQATKQYRKSKKKEAYKPFNKPDFKKVVDFMTHLHADSQAEEALFYMLKENNISFVFQYPIGPYMADYLIGQDLVLELDGPQHRDNKEYDEERDRYMRKMGYRVLRVPVEVMAINPGAIFKAIKGA